MTEYSCLVVHDIHPHTVGGGPCAMIAIYFALDNRARLGHPCQQCWEALSTEERDLYDRGNNTRSFVKITSGMDLDWVAADAAVRRMASLCDASQAARKENRVVCMVLEVDKIVSALRISARTSSHAPGLFDPSRVRWDRVEILVRRMSRLCEDSFFVPPEAVGSHRGYIERVCACLHAIAEEIGLVPRQREEVSPIHGGA